MSTADIIGIASVSAQLIVAVVAIWAVIVALNTGNKQIGESRRLATEERQHQSCPIVVPTKEIPNVREKSPGMQYLYTSEANPRLKGNIQWGLQFFAVPIEVSNIGTGPAFNVDCVLYGYDNAYINQFISWNNGPIGHGKDQTIFARHPFQDELWLERSDSVDGEHPLYYPSAGPNPNQAQACLTISYHDLFGNKLVSIFDYTPDHQWVRVFVSMPLSTKIALDLKELNDRKKQRVTKPKTP